MTGLTELIMTLRTWCQQGWATTKQWSGWMAWSASS